MNIVALGRAVQQLCQTKTFYMILNAVSGFETFGACDGGCLMVARALRQAGVRAPLYSLWGKYRRPDARPRWQHAMLKVGPNSFLDGDGIKTELEVYLWWCSAFEVRALRPTTKHWERIVKTGRIGAEIPYDERVVVNLADYFHTALDKRGILR